MYLVRCTILTVKCDFFFFFSSQGKVKKTLKEIARSLQKSTINGKVRLDWTEAKINLWANEERENTTSSIEH